MNTVPTTTSGYTPRTGDRIDLTIRDVEVDDIDIDDLYLAYGDGSTVCLPLDMPGLAITPASAAPGDVSLTSALAAAQEAYRQHRATTPAGDEPDEPVEPVTAADVRDGDTIRYDGEWLKVTRTRRRSGVPEQIDIDVETIPATAYVPAIPDGTIVLAPGALVDVPAGQGSDEPVELVGSTPLPRTAEDRALVTAISAEASRLAAGVAAEIRRRADQIEAIGGDLHEPTLSVYCGATTLPGAESERIAAEVERVAAKLGLPEPTTDAGDVMRHIGASASSGGVTVRVSGYIAAPPPGTCTHCGQTCGCGGAA